MAAGLTDDQVERLARTGRWNRRVRGVYVVAGAPDTPRQRIMVAYLATRAAGGIVSHLSAAAEWGLLAPSPLPHITVPARKSAASRGANVHRSDVPLVDRAHRGALIVTSVSRTIVDCASLLDRPTLEPVVDVALCRKLASPGSVEAAADRIGRGRVGKGMARDMLKAWSPKIEPGSPAEMRLIRQAAELDVIGLEPQLKVYDENGEFVARVDLGDPVRRRGFEYDGADFHNPRSWTRDEPRDAKLRAMGWDIQSVTKLDLCPGETRLRDIALRWSTADAA